MGKGRERGKTKGDSKQNVNFFFSTSQISGEVDKVGDVLNIEGMLLLFGLGVELKLLSP